MYIYNVRYSANEMVLMKEREVNLSRDGIPSIDSPTTAASLISSVFDVPHLVEEYVWVLAVNNTGRPIGIFEVAHGGDNFCCVRNREIFIRLCLCGASKFLLFHNHPGGGLNPSDEDKDLTKNVKDAGKLLQIELLDHIILSGVEHYSFKEAGLL